MSSVLNMGASKGFGDSFIYIINNSWMKFLIHRGVFWDNDICCVFVQRMKLRPWQE